MEEKKRPGIGVGVMILNREGKVLLGKRHEDPSKTFFKLTGTWTMPGGKLRYGESFEEGAKREVKEETGIKLNSVKVIAINNDINEYAHFITISLFSDNFEGEPQVLEPDEIIEWKWWNLNELPENIYFPSAKVIENYKQKKFYIK